MQLNAVNTVNPWGTTSTAQTGENSFVDSQGRTQYTPQFTQTTTLSPEQQRIFDQSQSAEGNMAEIANEQSAFLKDYLNKPFSFENSDAEQWAYDLASPRILQQQGQNEASLRTILANKGIREGSASWDAEMARLTQGNNDQLNQLALTGRGQAFGEAMATRNQPLNEITALLSGSQVSNPATMSGPTPQASVAGVDYTGLVRDKYQADVARSQNAMGGLFGLASSGIGLFSDRRLKRNIKRIGRTDGGTPLYSYTYVWGGPVQIGVMADEVPDAAFMHPSGYQMVDYGAVK
ncbi:MAG: tail fiber domain-containing protein [Cypionkella sp.]|nr:tail fiber domain-containing protein [Cypionkella sp.]